MPVHSGWNFTSSMAAAARFTAVLFKTSTNTNMSSTIEVGEVLLSKEVMLLLLEEKLETR
jgi:hypothetical protein